MPDTTPAPFAFGASTVYRHFCLLTIATLAFWGMITPPCVAQSMIEPTGPVEKVKSGFQFTEGPASAPDGTLYFSDIPANTIVKMTPSGEFSTFTDQSRHTNGMIYSADGRLFACQMDGQIVTYDPTSKETTVVADQFEGKRFNAPNDLVLDSMGGVYFTDPLFRAPEPLPQGVQAVYYVDNAGHVSRVTEHIAAPNGVALSPDGKRLYVIPSHQAEMLVYDVLSPGKLGDQRVFCTVKQPEGKSGTGGDGMAVDVEGNLYITTNLGVQIYSPQGEYRGMVVTQEQPANVTFGGADRKTLYITARTSLYRAPMPIAGLPSQ